MVNILFICQNNQLRSKVAEDFFRQFNRNPNNSARSAGIIGGNLLNRDLVRWADRMIIVADNVNPEMIENKFGKKVEHWSLSSDSKTIYRLIENKVKQLITQLG